MKDEAKQRTRAVQRFLAGEKPESICASMGRSRAWLYRWAQRYNGKYRYNKLGGKTPLKTLAATQAKLRFPNQEEKPRQRMQKPEIGRYHLVRLIRSNLKLNIFGELFPVPPELMLEYVVATIDVKKQKLKLFLDKTQVDEFDYKMR